MAVQIERYDALMTLCSALWSCSQLLPYQAVMQPARALNGASVDVHTKPTQSPVKENAQFAVIATDSLPCAKDMSVLCILQKTLITYNIYTICTLQQKVLGWEQWNNVDEMCLLFFRG